MSRKSLLIHLVIICSISISFTARWTTATEQGLTQILQNHEVEFDEKITAINDVTDEELLRQTLTSIPDTMPHIRNAIHAKLILLEPDIRQQYGNLQMTYHYSKSEEKYGLLCRLYIEHVNIEISDQNGETLYTSRFDGAPGKQQEHFETRYGMCSKTNEARVEFSGLCRKLLEEVENDTLLQIFQSSENPCLQSSAGVFLVQKVLQERGYDIEAMNGYIDTPTEQAIKKFQQDANLPATGILNQDTLEKLEIGAVSKAPSANQGELAQIVQNASGLTDKISAINGITDEAVLINLLEKINDQHVQHAIELRLLLLDPMINSHYGNLRFGYDLSKTSTSYGTLLTLYVEHVKIVITDPYSKVLYAYGFDGEPGKQRETFNTFGGVGTKTNKAPVDFSQICRDLANEFEQESLEQIIRDSHNACLKEAAMALIDSQK